MTFNLVIRNFEIYQSPQKFSGMIIFQIFLPRFVIFKKTKFEFFSNQKTGFKI